MTVTDANGKTTQSRPEPWMQIKVRASVDGAQIERLDEHLTQSLNFCVERSPRTGGYELAADGTYTVRVMFASDDQVFRVKTIIAHNCFSVVSEETHEQ